MDVRGSPPRYTAGMPGTKSNGRRSHLYRFRRLAFSA